MSYRQSANSRGRNFHPGVRCPACGEQTVLRRRSGKHFWGCTGYKTNGCDTWVATEWNPATGTYPFDMSNKVPYVPGGYPHAFVKSRRLVERSPLRRSTVSPSTRLPSPSHYQLAIFDFVANGAGHGVVNATAGSGKTTTLVEVAHLLEPDTKAAFVAFNKAAADQLKNRLPRSVKAQTIHSLGLASLQQHLRSTVGKRGELVENKYVVLCRSALASSGLERTLDTTQFEYARILLRGLVDQLRNHLIDPGSDAGVDEVIRRHGLPQPRSKKVNRAVRALARDVIGQGVKMAVQGVYDFTDMLYVPVNRGLPPRSAYDFLCVDEAQDLSPLQLAVVLRSVNDRGRLLFVGDRYQAIYGFTGADPASMETIVAKTGATELPLSVSYRCPCSHVELARQFSPDIEAAPGAGNGVIRTIRDDRFATDVKPGALVVCRTNAPVVAACLDLLASGTPAMLIGSDLSKRLKELARTVLKSDSVNGWEGALDRYFERRLQALAESATSEAAVEVLSDEVDCLKAIVRRSIVSGASTVDDVLNAIDSLCSVRNGAVRLSTVHRAKGLESSTVYVLYPHLMPLSKAATSEDHRAERCVQFVAVTRSKRELVFVEPSEEGGGQGESTSAWWAR